ncbi:hypothetical protein BUALT_Bualt13G0036700 [Buddleja alternifolia]|uniref:Cytochrome P450 n=1 Tax=Buddleja alternifolia TaxID=168488 RepID=A0AAV6WTL9_9LAMI|nr:hypothetical protein BUALT_Bualt13G0036700 [Buddleja alternifolia]
MPPCPPKLPVIGHLHHLVGGGQRYRALARLAEKFGPILHLQLGEVSAVVISSRDAAKQVLKDQDPACADRPESIATKIMWYDYMDVAFSPKKKGMSPDDIDMTEAEGIAGSRKNGLFLIPTLYNSSSENL